MKIFKNDENIGSELDTVFYQLDILLIFSHNEYFFIVQ